MTSDLLATVRSITRLAALQRADLLDTPAEEAFDRFTLLVHKALHTPVTLISLVDRDRQFFKSAVGLPEPWATRRQTPLTHSFCKYVVGSGDPLVVEDARLNPLLKDSPAVSELGAIAYAGVPLRSGDGHVIGTLCAIDPRPRTWDADEVEFLQHLGAILMVHIELRAQLRDTELSRMRLAAQVKQQEARDGGA
jgi:GAF domain-containing protein